MSTDAGRIHAVAMPKWGMTMTEGTLSGWLIGEGAVVEAGQELMEIETTKITNVVESRFAGVLRRQILPRGATAPVGALLGVIADPDVSEDDIAAFVGTYAEASSQEGAVDEAGVTATRVDTTRGTLNVLSAGTGSGLPVVLIHGFGGDLSTWALNQEALAQERRVHAFDLPAHGGSDPSGAHTPVELAEVTGALLDALDGARFHLVGHSLGGAIALLTAAGRPGQVASLTLIAPVGVGGEIDTAFVEGFVAADRRKSMKDVLGKLYTSSDRVSGDMIESVLRFKRLDGVPDALRAIASAFTANGGQSVDLRATLASLDMPVLLIWGEEDAIIPAAQAAALEGGHRSLTIPDAGHMPQVEGSASVNSAILEHIGAAEAGAS